MQYPTLNLNGTSKETLVAGYLDIERGIQDAIKALIIHCPHPRDYPHGGFQSAVEANNARIDMLQAMYKEITSLYEDVAQQGVKPIKAVHVKVTISTLEGKVLKELEVGRKAALCKDGVNTLTEKLCRVIGDNFVARKYSVYNGPFNNESLNVEIG